MELMKQVPERTAEAKKLLKKFFKEVVDGIFEVISKKNP